MIFVSAIILRESFRFWDSQRRSASFIEYYEFFNINLGDIKVAFIA